MDQSLLAAPHGFSQRATSFIASWRQGIRQTPFFALELRPRTRAPPQSAEPAQGRLVLTHTCENRALANKAPSTLNARRPSLGPARAIELVSEDRRGQQDANAIPDGIATPPLCRDCSQSTYDYTTNIPQGFRPGERSSHPWLVRNPLRPPMASLHNVQNPRIIRCAHDEANRSSNIAIRAADHSLRLDALFS